jgi:hypothetical protein
MNGEYDAFEVLPTDQFVVLQAEFETTAKRLTETNEEAEKAGLLVELRRILARMDEVVHYTNSLGISHNSN